MEQDPSQGLMEGMMLDGKAPASIAIQPQLFDDI